MTNSEQCCGISWRNRGPPQLRAATLLSPFSSCSYPLPHLSYQLLRFVCLFVSTINFRGLFETTSSDKHRLRFNWQPIPSLSIWFKKLSRFCNALNSSVSGSCSRCRNSLDYWDHWQNNSGDLLNRIRSQVNSSQSEKKNFCLKSFADCCAVRWRRGSSSSRWTWSTSSPSSPSTSPLSASPSRTSAT